MAHDVPALGLRRGTAAILPYDTRWRQEFEHEAAKLRSILGEQVAEIEHIGSTAVPGLASKPVLDIAISFPDASRVGEIRRRLQAGGYEYRRDQGEEGSLIFAKGSDLCRTHYLHLVPMGSEQWLRYLAFRDALRGDPLRRHRYGSLKMDLARRFPRDRASYQSGKAQFIDEPSQAIAQRTRRLDVLTRNHIIREGAKPTRGNTENGGRGTGKV